MRRLWTGVLLLVFAAAGHAGAIDVSYTVTGVPGAWDINFTVTNNMTAWPAQDVFRFGVSLSATNFVGSPGNFAPSSNSWTNFFYGGSPTIYNNVWEDPTFSDLFPPASVSGFIVGIPDIDPPSQVAWFAYSGTTTGDPADAYTGNGAFYNDSVYAGFEGTATAAATGVPEPSPAVLVLSASTLLIVLRRIRRRS